jgi:hypothetical protein
MEFNNIGAIVIITLLLVIVSILYVVYYLYYEIKESKSDIDKLIVNMENNNKQIMFNSEQIKNSLEYESDEEDDEDLESMEESDDDNQEEIPESYGIYDQVLIDSERLQQLQELQTELRGDTTSLKEIQDEDNEVNDNEDEAISFIQSGQEQTTEKGSCSKVLKTGKHKGQECGKECVSTSEYCKQHST